ncbi:MAG: O-antigen ligase family protein [Terriglobales bacterium]
MEKTLTGKWKSVAAVDTPQNRLLAAYATIVIFWAFYYFRPEDIITALYAVPLGKILGVIALVALILGTVGRVESVNLSPESKLVLMLYAWCVVCVPFSTWKGGAFWTVFGDYGKCIVMTIMIGIAVNSVSRLRRLLFIQASATALMAVIGCVFYRGMTRLSIGNGLYGNANDFAIMIALNWPICLGFMLATKNPFKKLLWGIGVIGMLWAVTLTYSRSGFMATMVAVVASLWQFGIKGKRKHVVIGAAVLALLLLPVLIPSGYGTRLEGIFHPSIDPLDKGSAGTRRELLIMSLKETASHPIFGVGPGQFESVTQTWFLTHNTYTQLSSEVGIPGLLLFLLILRRVFRNLKDVLKTERFRSDPQVEIFASALWASFAGYLVGAFFASYAYELFIYALVAFTGVLYNACKERPTAAPPLKQISKFGIAGTPEAVEVS